MTEVYTIRWVLQGDTGEDGSSEQAGTDREMQQAERHTQLIVTVQPSADGQRSRGQKPQNQQTTDNQKKAPPVKVEDQDPQGIRSTR